MSSSEMGVNDKLSDRKVSLRYPSHEGQGESGATTRKEVRHHR